MRCARARTVACEMPAATATSRTGQPERGGVHESLLVLGSCLARPTRGPLDALERIRSHRSARLLLAAALSSCDRGQREASDDRRAGCLDDIAAGGIEPVSVLSFLRVQSPARSLGDGIQLRWQDVTVLVA
jgi:hypothetical protein